MKSLKLKKKLSFFLLLLIGMGTIKLVAQMSNPGQNFYVAFANNDLNAVENVKLGLKIMTTVSTEVTLSFTENSMLNTTFTVSGGKSYDYLFTSAQAKASYSQTTTTDEENKKSIHVTASAPIVLYAWNSAWQSMDVTQILPVENWGTEYINFGTPYKTGTTQPHVSGFIMVAAENNTEIDWVAGFYPIKTKLQAGEIHYYHGSSYPGMKLTANKPFAFFENITQAKLPNAALSAFTFGQVPPTSQWGTQFILPSTMYEAHYARILGNQETEVTITYTDGSSSSFTLEPEYSIRYLDISTEEIKKRACYITSDKPVGICTYLISKVNSTIGVFPAAAWLPPLDKKERDITVSPFNIYGNHEIQAANQSVLIITPTAGREKTTVSINNDFPQTLNHPMHWTENNIGESGYSFARYYIGETNENKKLDATFRFDNPNGLIVLGYGDGSYFYHAGATAKNLETGFTVNGESYLNMNGNIYNPTTNFICNAFPNTLTSLVWKLNGIEIPNSRNQLTVNVNTLQNGYYTLSLTINEGVNEKVFTTFFHVGEKSVLTSSESNIANQGTKFYVAFGKNDTITTVKNNLDENIKIVNVELMLRMTALQATKVTLSFTENSALNQTLSIPAGITDYTFSFDEARAAYSGFVTIPARKKKSICVTSDSPISLHAINSAAQSVEATMVLPVENYGTEYHHVSLQPYGYADGTQCAGFIIIAKENNTTVNFYGNSVGGFVDFTETLNAGEVYHFNNTSASPHSFMVGMRVVADKPVAFFESNTSAGLVLEPPYNTTGISSSNYVFEQLPPVNHWGTRFILPTNYLGGAFARIYAHQLSNVSVYYTDGSSEAFQIHTGSGDNWKDIRITNESHKNSNSCYIVSDKPVCVNTYQIPYYYNNSQGAMQPGGAWLPPLGQEVHQILVTPLDVNGSHIYLGMRHDVVIITPTSERESTTVSINGDFAQKLNHPMAWVEDNIGGSGYSFARYPLGEHEAGGSINTTFQFDNPNGVMVLAYGQGSYCNYFYSAGYGARELQLLFYVNNISHIEIEGDTLCGPNFDFKIESNLIASSDITYPRWFFNDRERTKGRGKGLDGLSWSDTLSAGTYTVRLEFKDNNDSLFVRTTTFTVEGLPAISLLSTTETVNQTICIHTGIFNIIYSTTGATEVNFSGLPDGVTGDWTNNTITISGTPTDIGTYNYSIELTGDCGTETKTGTITVKPIVKPSVMLTIE